MNFLVKFCALVGCFLILYPLSAQAETMFSRYKSEKFSYNEKWANLNLETCKEVLKPGTYFASNEDGNMLSPKPQTGNLRTENAELREEIKKLSRDLADSNYLLAISNRSLKKVKDTSTEYAELETTHKETVSILSKQNEKVDKLEDEITKLLRQQNIRWFFSGVAVFLLGFIIGFSARREKRKSLL